MALTHHYNSNADERAFADANAVQPQLKAFFETITRQIADAEMRQAQMVHSIEQRLTNLGQTSHALKSQASGPVAAAFERIKEGMAFLSDRIGDATGMDTPAPNAPSPLDRVSADIAATMQQRAQAAAAISPAPRPAAPRNALDALAAIESSVAGDAARPWDENAAEALAELYETGGADVTRAPDQLQAELRFDGAFAPGEMAGMPATVKTQIDSTWFERRFAEISRHIEVSLHNVNATQSLNILGERFDLLESRFSDLATRADIDDVRAIGGHMADLVEHLEAAQGQLGRLDGIEQQLQDVAEYLRGSTASGMGGSSSSQGDVETFAEAAAERVVARMRDMGVPSQAASLSADVLEDLRGAIDQLTSEARQGEETTTALLDTLQQAMIRLLDRIDSLETGLTRRPHDAPARAPETKVETQSVFAQPAEAFHSNDRAEGGSTPRRQRAVFVSENLGGSEYAEKASPQSPEHGTATEQRSRHDLIAEARRARIKLAQEGQHQPARTETLGDVRQDPSSRLSATGGLPRDQREPIAGDVIQETKKRSGKLIVSAIAATLILGMGGVWFTGQDLGPADSAAQITPLASGQQKAPAKSETAGISTIPAAAVVNSPDADVPSAESLSVAPLNETTGEPAAEPAAVPADESGDVQGSSNAILPKEIPAITPSTVSLNGVAVDHPDGTSTGEGVAEARRTHAIAKMSNSLGVAASRNTPEMSLPDMAALETADPESLVAVAPAANEASDIVTESLPDASGASNDAADVEESGERSVALPPAALGPTSLRIAAAKGDASAEFEVGARFAEGRGVGQNFKEAARWYQRSASRGLAQAQYRLGTLYERGLGIGPDVARARAWYERSAEQGNVKAMHNLAVLNANQKDGTPDYQSAARWFSEASSFGLPDSQFNLAVLYETGLGVEQNVVEALKWMILAAKSGDKEAVRRRDILKGKLDNDGIATAEANAKAWRARRMEPMINDPRVAGDAWKRPSSTASVKKPDNSASLAIDPNITSF